MAKQQATKPATQLDTQTLSFLGLSQQPFTSNILSGEAIYTDSTRDQMLATLRHHMQFSDLVLIVEGEQGSGKTTLFRQLIQDNIPNLFLISILAEATDTLQQLQQKMSAHLKSQGSANYLDQDLKNLQVFDQFPITIIDDAHLLSDTTLQELIRYRSQLKQDKDTNLKILLLANPGMAKTIEDISDLQHNQLYVQQMPILSPRQVQAFIEHRLIKAGYRGGPVLPPETIQLIHKKSQGKPGQIMSLAVLMLEKHIAKLSHPGSSLLVKVLGIGGVLLLAAGSMYFWQEQAITSDTALTEAPASTMDTLQPVLAADDAVFLTAETDPTATTVEDALAQNTLATTSDPAVEMPAEPEPAPLPKDFSTSGIAPPTTATAAGANTTVKTTEAATKPSTPATSLLVSPPPAPLVTAPIPAPTPAPAPIPKAEPKPAVPVVVKTGTTENTQVQDELASMGIKNSEWLRTQKPSHWTLQLLGARDTTTLLKFAREHKLGDDSAWYETRLNGKPWFVMVHRIYANADTARKGLETLSPDLIRGQPWVKSLATIQKDLVK